jgi:hypothetical protein
MLSGLGTVFTGGLDLYVRDLPSAASTAHFRLKVTSKNPGQTEKIRKSLENLKLTVKVEHGIAVDHATKKGVRLVFRNSDATVLQSVYSSLRAIHEPVVLLKEAREVQYGSVFPNAAKAVPAKKHLESKAYVFVIVDNMRKGSTKVDQIDVPVVSTADLEQARKLLKDLKVSDSEIVVDHA